MRKSIKASLLYLLLATVANPVSAQVTTTTPATTAGKAVMPDTAPVEEASSVTRHSVHVGGKALAYNATAGMLSLRGDDEQLKANMFYVAYTRATDNLARPVTFFYNGGPGSSSLWLHMASFGPRRISLDPPKPAMVAPFRFVDNDATLLNESDLVFLDAIHTGFSRPTGANDSGAFLTADSDIDIFTRGIERYLTKAGRWNAPVYLVGESYGTSRSAGVVNLLQKHGIQVAGLIQMGTILDVGRVLTKGDQAFVANVPTFAATAAYHRLVPGPADLDSWLREVAAFADSDYSAALAKGSMLTDSEKQVVAERLARYVGLDAALLFRRNLRIPPNIFRQELLRSSNRILGEIDTRFEAEAGAQGADSTFDPSWTSIFRPMLSIWNGYVRDELKFDPGIEYRRAYQGAFARFDFKRANGAGWGNYSKDLSEAMIENPRLRVLSINGLYDLSTAFHGADYDYRHLDIPSSLTGSIAYRYYPSGHMLYVDDAVRRAIARDIKQFYSQ